MKSRTICFAFALVVALVAAVGHADYLVVKHQGVLKEQPRASASTVKPLDTNAKLILLDTKQSAGYYYAKDLESGTSGWIYRTFVRRYPGVPADVDSTESSVHSSHAASNADSASGGSHDDAAFDAYDPYDPNGKWFCYAGTPQRDHYPNDLTVLKNTGYVSGYDETRHDPAWTCYRCSHFERTKTPARPSWKQDKRTTSKITTKDYENTDYSRGHMAPNYAMFQCFGRTAQLESFLMSNVCPQFQANNDGIWGDIEDLIANEYAQDCDEVWVTCGPIFSDGSIPKEIGRGVQVPIAFYMIVVDEDGGEPRALAFRVPHTDDRGTTPEKYLTSIDEIEKETHLDFLSSLPDGVENKLESEKPTKLWPAKHQ